METAEVITEGGSQMVRLPKGYHFPTSTVQIRHQGEAVVLEPVTSRELDQRENRLRFPADYGAHSSVTIERRGKLLDAINAGYSKASEQVLLELAKAIPGAAAVAK